MTASNGAAAHRITDLAQLRAIISEPSPRSNYKLLDRLDDQAMAFLKASPFLLLSTASRDGRIEVSPKGDFPGFVRIEDERTVVIPDRPGNHLAFGLINILENPNVGIIVLVPATGETLRIAGQAEILADPDLLQSMSARGMPAVLGIRVHIERAYFHCARAVLRANLWKPETWPEPGRISFGAIIAREMGADRTTADLIDTNVNRAYQSEL